MSAISTRLLFFVLSIYVNRYYSFQLPVLNWGGVHSTATRSKIILNTVQYFENEFYRRGFCWVAVTNLYQKCHLGDSSGMKI